MKKFTLRAALPLSMVAMIGISSFAYANQAMDKKAVAILKNINGEAPAIANSFDGPAGMRGHILQGKNNEPSVLIWQTADGDHLMLGNLMDVAGRDLTQLAASHYGAQNPLQVAVSMAVDAFRSQLDGEQEESFYEIDDAISALRAAQSIPESRKVVVKGGRSLHAIYIYVDPRCGYCHALLDEMQKFDLAASDIDIHLIPVAVLGGESEQIAAAAIRADTLEHQLRFLKGDSSISPASPEDIEAIKQNSTVLESTMVVATPSVVAAFQGMPARAIIGPDMNDLINIAGEASIAIQLK